MSEGPRRRLRPPFVGPGAGPSRRPAPGEPDQVARALRAELGDEYAAPDEPRYWDAFEARVLVAVRDAVRDGASRAATSTTGAFRAVPAVAAEWWQALARWAQPGLVAAAVTIVIAAAALVDAHATAAASRAGRAIRDVVDAPMDAPAVAPALAKGPAEGSAEGRDATFRALLPDR